MMPQKGRDKLPQLCLAHNSVVRLKKAIREHEKWQQKQDISAVQQVRADRIYKRGRIVV